jgi:hypothetical protein
VSIEDRFGIGTYVTLLSGNVNGFRVGCVRDKRAQGLRATIHPPRSETSTTFPHGENTVNTKISMKKEVNCMQVRSGLRAGPYFEHVGEW